MTNFLHKRLDAKRQKITEVWSLRIRCSCVSIWYVATLLTEEEHRHSRFLYYHHEVDLVHSSSFDLSEAITEFWLRYY